MKFRTFLIAFALSTTSPCIGQWTLRTPMANPERIHGAVWDGTRFIVAGGFGYAARSTDGVQWEKLTVPGNPNLIGLASNGNGLSAALDDQGYTWATHDGFSWTRSDTSLGLLLGSLHWTGSRFATGVNVNVGSVYLQAESEDGLHWSADSSRIDPGLEPTFAYDSTIEFRLNYTLHYRRPGHGWKTCSTGTSKSMYGIAKGQGKWVVVGDSGIVLSSTDGQDWTKGSIGSATKLRQVAHLRGLWIAIGDSCTVFTSNDAATWTRRIKPPTIKNTYYTGHWWPRIVRDSTRWTVVENAGRGRILTSEDGVRWTVETLPGDGEFTTAAEELTREIVLSTGTGTLVVRPNGIIAWRQGHNDWIVPDRTPRADLVNVVHQNGIWLAAGVQGDSTLLWRSTDGVSWSASRLKFETSTQWIFKGLFAARGLFIASAYADGSSGSTMVSEDGLSWSSAGNCMLGKVVDNGQILVGIDPGNYRVYSSEDGRSWTLRKSKSGYNQMNDVNWNGRMFVAVGDHRTLWTSTNGIDWIEPEFDDDRIGDLRAASWNGATWSVVGVNGSLVSTDGLTWTGANMEFGSGFVREAFWRGHFVSTVRSFSGRFEISTSSNGVDWSFALKDGPRSGTNGCFVGFHDLGDTLYAMTNRTSLFRTGDAENWQAERFTGNAIQAMAHAGGLVVAVGDNSNIWTRPTTASEVGVSPRSAAMVHSLVVSGNRLRIPGAAGLSGDLLDLQGRILSHGQSEGSDLVLDLAGRSKGTWALRLRQADLVTTRVVAIP